MKEIEESESKNDNDLNEYYKLLFTPTPKESKTYPLSDIYMPDFECSNYNELIDDNLLRGFFEVFNRMYKLISVEGVIQTEYVLDIDLDYFTTPNALKPKKYKIFAELVKNAAAITIAKESICVNYCSKGKSSADDLLKELLLLIEGILSN